jgi:hypothetical protein
MSLSTIDPLSKQFWTNYVTTAQYSMGQELHAEVNQKVYDRATQNHVISSTYRPLIINYTDKSWNWDWSTKTTTIVQPTAAAPEKKKTDKEKNEESAKWAMIIGPIVAIAAAFASGYAWKAYSRQTQTANYTNEVQAQAFNALPRTPVRQSILQLLDHQSQIDSMNSSKITNYFYASIALLIGGGTLAAGGFAAVPMLITAGYVILVASAVIALANLGYHWNDQADLRPHYIAIAGDKDQRVQGLADVILNQLTTCEENMQSSYEVPPAYSPLRGYAPLYPDLYNSAWQMPSYAAPSAPPADGVELL